MMQTPLPPSLSMLLALCSPSAANSTPLHIVWWTLWAPLDRVRDDTLFVLRSPGVDMLPYCSFIFIVLLAQ
jgi:hypothetical protein